MILHESTSVSERSKRDVLKFGSVVPVAMAAVDMVGQNRNGLF